MRVVVRSSKFWPAFINECCVGEPSANYLLADFLGGIHRMVSDEGLHADPAIRLRGAELNLAGISDEEAKSRSDDSGPKGRLEQPWSGGGWPLTNYNIDLIGAKPHSIDRASPCPFGHIKTVLVASDESDDFLLFLR
jgi:hypothetical protein